ncbi:hypothetical protein SELSPUOL_01372 [Selenomonas sputigena ATCC 35185]|uniref:Uncharacterized protein n=1 Tax=Selenomonas sputigena (strain ATCC 35185 / DSM 20758 / CCUG 44933 / VPI D19B-28) TaxID=546271 RepID=C9LV80_SELS3|nr:hypothetical protein SELSPUOL_01372 [Selenomonas sputigena ATCC 35185]
MDKMVHIWQSIFWIEAMRFMVLFDAQALKMRRRCEMSCRF